MDRGRASARGGVPQSKGRRFRTGKDLPFEWMLTLVRHEHGPSHPFEEGLREDADHQHAGGA
jgi:hypothetical protein